MQLPSVLIDHHTATFDWRDRLRAAGIHLGLSALVAAMAALLVFALWYPYPYREISGGRSLFLLVITVDVVLGPLLTFAIFDRAKPRRRLRRDLAVVALLQLAGLAYGLWTVNLARPDTFSGPSLIGTEPPILCVGTGLFIGQSLSIPSPLVGEG